MRIALIETSLHWGDVNKNLNHYEELLKSVESGCRMVFLPEMFSTGFTMEPEKLEPGAIEKVPQWMSDMSVRYNIALGGSTVAAGKEGFFNRFYFCLPNGEMFYYDKRHLFRMGEEDQHYQPGKERKIFYFDGWRILPQVCYDLRFPVWSRNRGDYDLMVNVANWPSARQDVWSALLKARAIENQCYVAGVNRTGSDPNVNYAGGSVVFSPKGEILSSSSKKNSQIIYANLDLNALNHFRRKFPVWKDADEFEVKL